MTVTRQRLDAPPEQPQVAHTAHPPEVDQHLARQQDRDRVKVVCYFGGRTGQRLSACQAAAATGLPLPGVQQAIDALSAAEFLQPAGLRLSRFGLAETWRRPGPEERTP